VQEDMQLRGDRYPRKAPLLEPRKVSRISAELPDLIRMHRSGPVQVLSQPASQQPQALVRLVVVLWDKAENGTAHRVASLRDLMAVAPNEHPSMVGYRAHSHDAAKRLRQLVGE